MKFKGDAERLYSNLDKLEVGGKVQYFKKRRVFPIINEDGSFNWYNFLTMGKTKLMGINFYWKLLGIALFILVILGVLFEYVTNVKVGAECIARENAIGLGGLI